MQQPQLRGVGAAAAGRPILWRAEMPDRPVSLSGLTDAEAQEFHRIFMSSFIGFVAVCAVAHLLVWLWRPWL